VWPPQKKLAMHAVKENGSAAMREQMDVIACQIVRMDWWERLIAQPCEGRSPGLRRKMILCNLMTFGDFEDTMKVGFDRNAMLTKIERDGKRKKSLWTGLRQKSILKGQRQ
jgi:hypothetical protein